MLSSSGTCGCAAIFRKYLVSGSLIFASAATFVGSAPTSVARFEAPVLSTAIWMNSHAPVLFFAFFGITQLWNELAAVRPGCGPDWGRDVRPSFVPSACSNALITNGNICTIAALPEVKYVFASLFSCVDASAFTQPCCLNLTSCCSGLTNFGSAYFIFLSLTAAISPRAMYDE